MLTWIKNALPRLRSLTTYIRGECHYIDGKNEDMLFFIFIPYLSSTIIVELEPLDWQNYFQDIFYINEKRLFLFCISHTMFQWNTYILSLQKNIFWNIFWTVDHLCAEAKNEEQRNNFSEYLSNTLTAKLSQINKILGWKI